MISYQDFQEYYTFLDDYLFDVFEQLKATNCFKLGVYTRYEGIINISEDKITISYVHLDANMDYTDFVDTLDLPSYIVFDNEKLEEYIQMNKAYGAINA